MPWFNKLEKKLGRFAISHLMYYILALYVVGLLIVYIKPDMYYLYLSLDVSAVMRGQVWRLITFLMYPPIGNNIFFTLISLYVYWMFGMVLESVWGSFRFNVYYFGGVIWTIIGAFVAYFIYGGNEFISFALGMGITTQYINFSLFIGYAFTFPENQMLLFFILPIKAKILAWIELAVYGVLFAQAIVQKNYITCVLITCALLNILIFWLITKRSPLNKAQRKVRKEFKEKIKESRNVNRHVCAICGKTSQDFPDETFRYCSKCDGNFEYCSEHLYTHTHVTKENSEILNLPK